MMCNLWYVCLMMVLAGLPLCKTEVSNESMSYEGRSGPLCWGPGIWPHPQHCRLFTICTLKYEVRGTLYACPPHTGFSPKHLKCVPSVLVPMCQNSSELNATALEASSVHQLGTTDVTKGLCDVDTSPYCLNSQMLVACGPNNSYVGSVNCTNHGDDLSQICDEEAKACVSASGAHEDDIFSSREELDDFEDSMEQVQLVYPSDTVKNHLFNSSDSMKNYLLHPSDTEQNYLPLPSNTVSVNTSDTLPNNTSDSSELPSAEVIVCLKPGLQCHDSITIMDCPDDLSEPTFVMSCANIITSTENETAIGFCNVANATCVLLVEKFVMNLEISTLDFGDSTSANVTASREELDMDFDEDEEGPELYDSDLLRESSGEFGWDSLSWFRNSPNVDTESRETTENRNEKEQVKGLDKKDKNENKKSKTLNSIIHGNQDKLNKKTASTVAKSSEKIRLPVKLPSTIKVPSGNDAALSVFLEKCNKGGLYCLDNTTLVACSGDPDSDTYAIRCAHDETTASGDMTLKAYCDVTTDSCVVDVIHADKVDDVTTTSPVTSLSE